LAGLQSAETSENGTEEGEESHLKRCQVPEKLNIKIRVNKGQSVIPDKERFTLSLLQR
jgi:hypothetical protein